MMSGLTPPPFESCEDGEEDSGGFQHDMSEDQRLHEG
jgi:hypothetical protein